MFFDRVCVNQLAGQRVIACLIVFFVAIGVRSCYLEDNSFWLSDNAPDNQYKVSTIASGMPAHYRNDAQLLVQREVRRFLTGLAPPNDANVIMHPPGYPVLTACISLIFDTSDATMRIIHLLLTSCTAVVAVLVVSELSSIGIATIAGLLIALSPQLANYSLMLRPDNLVPLPMMLSLYFIALGLRRSGARYLAVAGVCIGLACWLRADVLLFAPFLALFIVPFIFGRGTRVRYSLVLLAATTLTILPITIRNYVVFRHFIPLSLGSGVTFVQGIAEYDEEHRFNLPVTDFQTMQLESRAHNRSDYAHDLFNPDGVRREKWRLEQGLEVVRSHPLWFAGIMLQRVVSMLRFERVPLVSARPPVTRNLPDSVENTNLHPSNLEHSFRLPGGDAEPAQLVSNDELDIREASDYVLTVPIRVEQGSTTIYVVDTKTGETIASTGALVPLEDTSEQPVAVVRLPFASGRTDRIQLRVEIGGRNDRRILQMGRIEVLLLGTSTRQWTQLLRVPISLCQRIFTTAFMVPVLIMGVGLLLFARQRSLILWCAIPAYYLTSHAFFHTEYRMVLSLHHSYLILCATAIGFASKVRIRTWTSRYRV